MYWLQAKTYDLLFGFIVGAHDDLFEMHDAMQRNRQEYLVNLGSAVQ